MRKEFCKKRLIDYGLSGRSVHGFLLFSCFLEKKPLKGNSSLSAEKMKTCILWIIIICIIMLYILCCEEKEWRGHKTFSCPKGTATRSKSCKLIWTEERLAINGPSALEAELKKISLATLLLIIFGALICLACQSYS